MRSYYSTHKSIRLFVLGVPEGWQVALYDIDKQQWIDNAAWVQDTLRGAKAFAQERAAVVSGEKLPQCKWH